MDLYRKNRSGYALVILALAAMAIMASQTGTQGTAEMYEMSQVNQYLTDVQMRWLAEGLLNHQLAVCVETPPAQDKAGYIVTVTPGPPNWFTAGTVATRSAATQLELVTTNLADSVGTRKIAGYVRYRNLPGGALVIERRTVGRRQLVWDGVSNNWSDLGFYIRNSPAQF